MTVLLLRLPKVEILVEVTVERGQLRVSDASGRITFALDARDLPGKLRELAAQLESAEPDPDPARPFAWNRQAQTWGWLTPKMVVEYFENSPVLSVHAADVRAVLAAQIDSGDQLDADVQACLPHLPELVQEGKLVYGAQSRIARILGLTNGGGHRGRILAVAGRLESSTSTSTTSSTAKNGNSRPAVA
jgi:hypothetical protein